jgi:hypothetical protein
MRAQKLVGLIGFAKLRGARGEFRIGGKTSVASMPKGASY